MSSPVHLSSAHCPSHECRVSWNVSGRPRLSLAARSDNSTRQSTEVISTYVFDRTGHIAVHQVRRQGAHHFVKTPTADDDAPVQQMIKRCPLQSCPLRLLLFSCLMQVDQIIPPEAPMVRALEALIAWLQPRATVPAPQLPGLANATSVRDLQQR
jgi:hypothetical protein